MSVRVSITCDTPGCGAYCSITASEVAAREEAADRWGWSVDDRGLDRCAPCMRSGS